VAGGGRRDNWLGRRIRDYQIDDRAPVRRVAHGCIDLCAGDGRFAFGRDVRLLLTGAPRDEGRSVGSAKV